jgi:hypothetical protein
MLAIKSDISYLRKAYNNANISVNQRQRKEEDADTERNSIHIVRETALT